jgi:hypothetical protein
MVKPELTDCELLKYPDPASSKSGNILDISIQDLKASQNLTGIAMGSWTTNHRQAWVKCDSNFITYHFF